MSKQDAQHLKDDQPVSKVKLALGAASLFLFIIGVKRSFRMEHAAEIAEPAWSGGARSSKETRKASTKQQTA